MTIVSTTVGIGNDTDECMEVRRNAMVLLDTVPSDELENTYYDATSKFDHREAESFEADTKEEAARITAAIITMHEVTPVILQSGSGKFTIMSNGYQQE